MRAAARLSSPRPSSPRPSSPRPSSPRPSSPRKRGSIAILIALALSAAFAHAATPTPAPKPTLLLQPDRVWTGDGASHAGWAVLVRDGAIVAVGDANTLDIPADAQRLPLPGTTLVPGLIDLHSHVFLHPYDETPWNDQVIKESQTERTLRAARHARDTLQAGFTTLRDLGTEGAQFADVGIKHAIDTGMIDGPRICPVVPSPRMR
jgi:imidazolonepropionase-like amidohydrolase